MDRSTVVERATRWLREKPILVAVVIVVIVGATAGTLFSLRDGADPPSSSSTPTPIDFSGSCFDASVMGPPEDDGSRDWEEIDLPPENNCFRMTATDSDAGVVRVGSGFVLESLDPITAERLAALLQIVPAIEVTVEQESLVSSEPVRAATRYFITPVAPLARDTVYQISLLDEPGGRLVRTWAFQSERPLRVVQSLPADQSTNVPVDVGIEFTFSHEGVTGVQDAFGIEPSTEGRFEVHKRTVVFVPKNLEPATLYTVSLSPGVRIEGSETTLGEEFVFRFETGVEGRDGYDVPLQFSQRVWDSSTADAPIMTLFGLYDQQSPEIALPIEVYRFSDIGAFEDALTDFTDIPTWAYFTRAWHTIDTSGLDRVSVFEAELQAVSQYGDRYVVFPEPLPEGHYVVETEYEGQVLQVLLQVTDVSTYVAVSTTQTIVWAHDLDAGVPLSGASITSSGVDLAVATDADGVAFFGTPDDLIQLEPSAYGYTTSRVVSNLIVTAADGREAIVPLADIFNGFRYYGFREYVFSGSPGAYWRYLYTDRNLYHPNDTVNFWGLVRSREGPLVEQELTVEVTGWDYSSATGQSSRITIARADVTASEMGTFIGEMTLKGVSPGYYTVEARLGEQTVASVYLQVQDFVAPAYKLEVTPSLNAVIAGDEVDFTVQASFFEGTPVPDVDLRVGLLKLGSNETPITTDESGAASVTYIAQFPAQDSLYTFGTLNVTPARAEEAEIHGSGWVQIFPSAVTIEAESSFEDGTARVTGTTYQVDLTRLNDDTASSPRDFLGPVIADQTVTAHVTEHSYERVEIGERYDFINKIVRKEYAYNPVTTTVGSYTVQSDGNGQFQTEFPAFKDRRYSVDLSTADSEGRAVRQDFFIYTGSGNYQYFGGSYLDATDPGPFAVGETVSVTMRRGPEELPAGDGRDYLFLLARNGIKDYALGQGPQYSFAFNEDHIPNINVLGVRFTGLTYLEVSYPFSAKFDQSARSLNVAVTPQEELYRPGDEATLDVLVTNASGEPVQAEVLLSAIDEAVYRLQGESFFRDLDILESIYEGVGTGILETHASHYQGTSDGGAERGGDGGQREDFKDTALFDRVTTDAEGRASITFALPDNLTSWRITSLALSDDLHAGFGVAILPVGLPFFVEVTMNDSYLLSDEPNIRLRAFGEALSSGDEVSFRLEASGLIDEPLTLSGQAFTPVDVPLPALREGRHEIIVTASAGALEDALVREFTVVESRLSFTVNRFHEVRPGEDISLEGADDGLTQVVIADHNRGRYYSVLRALSWSYGDRVDQLLARVLSRDLLSRYFEQGSQIEPEFNLATYQTDDGGIAILPFADDDLAISARVAALAPDSFGQQELIRFFRSVIDEDEETRERIIIALYGMAALGEPVLPQVSQMASADDLETRERLYLALAASELGDVDTARGLYRGLLDEFGERRGASVRLKVDGDQDDILEATSLAAVLGASLGDGYAPLLFDYTLKNYTTDILIELEQISFLSEALPRLSELPTRVAYSYLGERVETELEGGRSEIVLLTHDELDGLDLETLEGIAGVTTSFLAPIGPDSIDVDDAMSITRTYQGQADGSVTLSEGDLVRIELTYNLPETAASGCYQVSDFLPSGLRPVTRPSVLGSKYGSANLVSAYSVEGQRISFCVGKEEWPIVYYARASGTGSFTAEPAIIQSQQVQESVNLTAALEVEIR